MVGKFPKLGVAGAMTSATPSSDLFQLTKIIAMG
jgi:hypothetical protein